MTRLTIAVLRGVIVIGLAGSVFVQVVMVPLLWVDLEEAPASVRVPFVVIAFLGIVTLQVCGVAIWRLLTLVRRDRVFSAASAPVAFRNVDAVIAAIGTAALLTFGMAVVLAPGEAVAPGMVLLVCGASLVVGGVALVVLVLRALLAKAVALSLETGQLRAELDAVI